MAEKDESGLRFSDLFKKGAREKSRPEGRSAEDDSKKEDEAFRFSNLDYLKQKGKPREAARDASAPLTGDDMSANRAAAADVADRQAERISLKDFESFKALTKTAARTSQTVAHRKDSDAKKWWMGMAKTVPVEEIAPENRVDAEIPHAEPEGTTRMSADPEMKTEENASLDIPVGDRTEEPRPVDDEVSVEVREKSSPITPQPIMSAEPDVIVNAGEMDTDALYEKALAFVRGVKRTVSAEKDVDLQPAVTLISRMTKSPRQIDDLSRLTMQIIAEEDYNVSHQVNVMIYALKLGFGLDYSSEKLIELGLGALMHDVGMFRIPESIALKTGKLTEREIEVIKTHAEIGKDILMSLHSPYASLPDVAYEHHEREGGQGYPRGLKGNEIHEYARIVALVDSYEAMTHSRPYRKALMQSFSAKELIKSRSALFSPLVIKIFLKEISLYPLGSYVLLNNKSIGEVVATNHNHPLRPTVRMLYDGEGNQVRDDVMVKLNENPLFFIVDGVPAGELPAHR